MESPTDTTTTTFTVDKMDQQNADAFAGCKVGDQYKVTVEEDEEDHLVLSSEKIGAEPEAEPSPEPEEAPMAPSGYESKSPAIRDMMKRR